MTERDDPVDRRGGAAHGHVPVLRDRVVALLTPAAAPGGAIVDATLGLGGHSLALLEALPTARLIGLDRDPAALAIATERLSAYADRVHTEHAVYDELPQVLARLGVERVDGVLFDLGVSSMQLDATERGFAYAADAPLDMRMDQTAGRTAADVVNSYSVDELARVLSEYGDERFARRIAQAIVRVRAAAPFTTTGPLAELVRESIPAATRRHGGHPAKRTFQALRIEVNDELAVLERAVPAAIAALRVGGRLVVLAYQSLEDRIVKRAIAAGLQGCICPPDLPVCACGRTPELRVVGSKHSEPTAEEIAANPRAASARLRAVERLRDAA
ncbi:MAG TPA: 16S rRNA (cytosine(1402)-N(4))-methyltransferase RsmH [Mycobacteriales bacterium]|nr:16S rRNA (cytosine(1402)-N(4))-methyltransferase RsmH [Mycobacteriales bacterium]